jgi:hypothetical protein
MVTARLSNLVYILRYRGDVNSISAARMLIKSPKAYEDSMRDVEVLGLYRYKRECCGTTYLSPSS